MKTTIEKKNELRDKIMMGLELTYKKLIEFKKSKNSVLVIMIDNEIVKVKP